jgi:hypothetical protein
MFKKSTIVLISFALILGLSYALIQTLINYYEPLYQFEKKENNNGIFKEYYKNGKLKSFESYFKGTRHGLSYYLTEKGDTNEIHNYYLGQRHGNFKYFTENGSLVIEELYLNGMRQQRVIVNDSLYTYDYMAYQTGLMAFEHACADCHQSIDEIVTFQDSSLYINRLDSIHLCLLDTLSDTTYSAKYLKFNLNELDAIKHYILKTKEANFNNDPQFRIIRNTRRKIAGSKKAF